MLVYSTKYNVDDGLAHKKMICEEMATIILKSAIVKNCIGIFRGKCIAKMLKQVEHESAPGMKISFGWEDFQNTNSFRMGISASYSSK